MTLSHCALLQSLAALTKKARPPTRYVVAFSGGLDSTVLLHALKSGQENTPVIAVHVDHGLHKDSKQWREHCESIASGLGVEFHSKQVSIDDTRAQGLEAAAREARYDGLASFMAAGDWLLSAHHQDDLAETLLMNLFRGGGPAGLAGIAAIKPFGAGYLARPLLLFSQGELRNYASAHDLSWIDDPSNQEQRFDRNFLRHEIMPRIESHWPEVAKRLQRSSGIASDAATLLDDLAAIDAASLGERIDRLDIEALSKLSDVRQRNVLRYAFRQLKLPTPSAAHVQRLLEEVIAARDDAEPVLRWHGVEVRRYRKALYLLPANLCETPSDPGFVNDHERLQLEHGLGELRLETGASQGLSGALLERGLELRYRHGGEEFKPIGQAHTRKLKKLLQEAGIVPWMRDRIPLLYSGGELVAVADLWLADDAASTPGVAIHWDNRPAIH